ncbi:MAG: ribulose-phosphate 3-epimerase [Thermoplasmataceae archaeon]
MLVSPSIISAKLYDLQGEIGQCENAGAYSFHLDVMDGHFAPNLTMGPDFVKAVKHCSHIPLETHLMMERPDKYYRSFVEAGSDVLMIHYESPIDLGTLFHKLDQEGIRRGLVVNPETNISEIEDLIPGCHSLLIMSVHPGFSGQKFITDSLRKIKEARKLIDSKAPGTLLEIDGGINLETGKLCAEAGVDVLISASYIFGNDIGKSIGYLKALGKH